MLHCTQPEGIKPVEIEKQASQVSFSASPYRYMTGRIELTINIGTLAGSVNCTMFVDPKTPRPCLYHGDDKSGPAKYQVQQLFERIKTLITDDFLKRYKNPGTYFTKINIIFSHDPTLNMTSRIISNNTISMNAIETILQKAENTTNASIKTVNKRSNPNNCIIS